MVKAVNENPNTLGNPPKKSSADSIVIENPDAEVEFVINTDNDNSQLDTAVSDKAIGGTELMRNWLFTELDKREPGIRDKFQFIST